MTVAEHVLGLRQRVVDKTAELHALQRELLSAERGRRKQELRLLAESQGSAVGRQGLVVQAGQPPDAVISRGFPSSRSEIDGARAVPVEMTGTAHVELDEVAVFQVPKSRTIVPALGPGAGESGKGPALVQLFG